MMAKGLRVGIALGITATAMAMPAELAAAPRASVRDAEGVVKLIINLNHRLCARVTYVESTSQAGVFHVRCVENVGGRRTVNYLVDGRSNTVVRI